MGCVFDAKGCSAIRQRRITAKVFVQQTSVDQAIGTLRKRLDENLANEAKMRAEQKQIGAQWQQKAVAKVAPAAR